MQDMGKIKKKKLDIQAKTGVAENNAYTREDAYETLKLINEWTVNMDWKSSFSLAFSGVLIGCVFKNSLPGALEKIVDAAKFSELSYGDVFLMIIVALSYLMEVSAVFCFIAALFARIKNDNKDASVFFFGTIGKMPFEDYRRKANHMTEEEMLVDLEEQIHTNSKICTKKAEWYNRGMIFLAITIFLWFICNIFGMI